MAATSTHSIAKEVEKFNDVVIKDSKNPYETFLVHFKSLNYKSTHFKSPAVNACNLFSHWIVEHNPDRNQITLELKKSMFLVASEAKCTKIRDILFDTFNLGANKELLKDHIPLLQEKLLFVELCEWLIIFNDELPDHIERFLMPVIALNRKDTVISFLKAFPECAKPFAKLLDSYLQLPDFTPSTLKQHPDLALGLESFMESNKPVLKAYFLEKLLLRIGALHHIDIEELPNLNLKCTKHLLALLIRNWKSNNISDDAIVDHFVAVVRKDEILMSFVKEMLEKLDSETLASKFTSQLEIPNDINIKGTGIRKPIDKRIFYKPDILPFIVYVDSMDKRLQLFDCIKSKAAGGETLVGIDTEWNPCCSYKPKRLSLLQIAFSDRIFIIDCLALTDFDNFLRELNRALLHPNIMRLGYSLRDDRNIRCDPDNVEFMSRSPRCQDLKDISFGLPENRFPYSIPTEKKTKNIYAQGLSGLTWRCLGNPIDKTETLSYWEKRPLRPDQIYYAAVDAFVLIEIYKCLNTVIGVNDSFISQEKVRPKKSKKSRRWFPKRKGQTNGPNSSPQVSENKNESGKPTESIDKNGMTKNTQHRPAAEAKNDKVKIPKPLSPFTFCLECLKSHNTRKCPDRIGRYKLIKSMFKTIRNLGNALKLDELCYESMKSLKLLNPGINDKLPELGILVMKVEKMVLPPRVYVSRTMIRRTAVTEFIMFFSDMLDLLNACKESIMDVCCQGKTELVDDASSGKIVCSFCKKTGHKKTGCFVLKNIKKSLKGFTIVKENLETIANEFHTMHMTICENEKSCEEAEKVPGVKKLLKKVLRCSYCFRYGHSDIKCMSLSHDSHQISDFITSCLHCSLSCFDELSDFVQ